MDPKVYAGYLDILRHELVPALGCTEPIAIAYASAKVRDTLGTFPRHVTIHLSGNMIKNVKSVTVPNSGGERGIPIAVALGCTGGDASLGFEVLQNVTEADVARAKELAGSGFCDVKYAEGRDNLYIRVEAFSGGSTASVTIEREHTNITLITKDGYAVYTGQQSEDGAAPEVDKSLLNVRDICAFASEVDTADLHPILDREIEMNTAISEEGLSGCYGEHVGSTLMAMFGDRVEGRAAARAAAGSDARMNGCSMPVIINSGSGNQGMTITLPICEYAKEWGVSDDIRLRALALGNLISVHIKRHIGSLSAFCGAVSAGCGAACGIAWMDGLSYDQICMTITNALASAGGILCDGAKSSCAAKIAESVIGGLLSYRMAKEGHVFRSGEGIVGADVETTIKNIGRVGREGMKPTDVEVLNIMVGN